MLAESQHSIQTHTEKSLLRWSIRRTPSGARRIRPWVRRLGVPAGTVLLTRNNILYYSSTFDKITTQAHLLPLRQKQHGFIFDSPLHTLSQPPSCSLEQRLATVGCPSWVRSQRNSAYTPNWYKSGLCIRPQTHSCALTLLLRCFLQAKWAKQHQPDDKIFVQALCDELKALELDPEKEDIWAPNNLLRKYVKSR